MLIRIGKRGIAVFSAVCFLLAGAPMASASRDTLALNKVADGWFVNAGLGINGFVDAMGASGGLGIRLSKHSLHVMPSFEVMAGKWITPELGLRAGVEMARSYVGTPPFGRFYFHNDLLWDITNRIMGYNPDRPWSIIPYGHFGLTVETRDRRLIERVFSAGAGLMGRWNVYGPFHALLDMRVTPFISWQGTQGLGSAFLGTLMVGGQYDLTPIDWHSPSRNELYQHGFGRDWFVSLGGGFSYMNVHPAKEVIVLNGGKITPMADFSFGKWMTPFVGLRLGLQGGRYMNRRVGEYKLLYPHIDLLVNVSNLIHPNDLNRFWTASPYLNYGVWFSFDKESNARVGQSYAFGLGLLNKFHFYGSMNVFLDLRSQMLSSTLAERALAIDYAALLGLSFDINRSTPWHYLGKDRPEGKAVRYYDNGLFDNWFAFAGFGVATYMALHRQLFFNGRFTHTMDLGIGKWFSPWFGVRLGWQGGNLAAWGREPRQFLWGTMQSGMYRGRMLMKEKAGMNYVHGDVMWNIGNSLYGYNPDRNLDIVPYMHFGMMREYGKVYGKRQTATTFASGAGLLASWRLFDRFRVKLDGRVIVLPYQLRLDDNDNNPLAASLLAGVSYEVGRNRWIPETEPNPKRRAILNNPSANWFVSAAMGANFFANIREYKTVKPSLGMDIAVGKWASPAFGLRLGYQGLELKSDATGIGDFSYVHGDVLWNFINSFVPYNPDRRWAVVPYLHMGVGRFSRKAWVVDRSTDVVEDESVVEETEEVEAEVFNDPKEKPYTLGFVRTFMGGPGIFASYRLFDGLNAFVDFRAAVAHPGALSMVRNGPVMVSSVMAGLAFEFDRRGWDVPGYERRASEADQEPTPVLGRFRDQWFVDVSTGINLAFDLTQKMRVMGPATVAGEFAFGKWVAPDFAWRVGYQGVSTKMQDETRGYSYIHADLLWNATRSFTHLRPHIWEVVPYSHFGLIMEWEYQNPKYKRIENELAAGLGLLNLFRIHENVAVTADLRGTLLTAQASAGNSLVEWGHNKGFCANMSALLGLQLRFDKPEWYWEGKGHYAKPFSRNWFIGVGAGVQHTGGVRPTMDASFGKWLSPWSGVRLGYQGFSMKGKRNPGKYGYHYIHGDFLVNVTQLFGKKFVDSRRVDFAPYFHGGVLILPDRVSPTRSDPVRDFAGGLGLLTLFNVSSQFAISADLRGTFLKEGLPPDWFNPYAWSALVGITYKAYDKRFEDSDTPDPEYAHRRNWAISLNLADLAELGTVGLGFQYGFHRHWTAESEFKFNLLMLNKNLYNKSQTFSIGARWWPWYIHAGFWVKGKLQTQGFKRNGVPLLSTGNGEAFGVGASAGYALLLSRRFNLDFGLGGWGGRRFYHSGQPASWFVEPEIVLAVSYVF